jgi:hypothetical protein
VGTARHYQSGLVRQFYPNANCHTGAETPTRATAGGERDIVTPGPIVITATIGVDASGLADRNCIGVH